MCGFAGFQGDFEAEQLRQMSCALSHRGPDDSGQWYSAPARSGLAHRRLSIIDVSALGHQPMRDALGRVVAFNGEIYNFVELRAELLQRGYCFKGRSDTEVLLALYAAHGEAMLPKLNGIFAFAIYDPTDDSMFVAGDQMGVKPLYCHEATAGFVFASELKALIAAGIRPPLNVQALFRTLGFLWSAGGATPLNGVFRLGPGESLRVRKGRIVRRSQWSPGTWARGGDPDDDRSDVARVRDAVRTAVRRQMVADVPVGAFLSGGLDSSAVVAMARDLTPNLDCFTIDTGPIGEPGLVEDLPFARRVARHLGVKLHEVRVDPTRIAADLEQMVFQLDEPIADLAPLNVLYISRLARQSGMKVLLSGAGGDDIFSGYRRHRAIGMERLWSGLPIWARRRLRTGTSRLDQRSAWNRRLAKSFARADQAPDRRLTGYFLWARPDRLLDLFAAEHRQVLADDPIERPLDDYLAALPNGLCPLHRMLALDQRFFLADHNLLYTDKMGMAAGVEIRVPLLDQHLVRLANSLPSRVKQRGTQTKWIFKKAMEPYLPREVIHRPKTGFGAPLRRWLRHELREVVHDTLSPSALRKRGLFDPAAVERLITDDREGAADAAYTILGLVCVEIWCRRFMDGSQRVSGAEAALTA